MAHPIASVWFPASASPDPPMQMDPAHRSPTFQQTTSVIHKVIQPSPWPPLQAPSFLSLPSFLPSLSSASSNIAAPSPTALLLTCRRTHAVWVANSPSIIRHVAIKDIPAFDQALIAIRIEPSLCPTSN